MAKNDKSDIQYTIRLDGVDQVVKGYNQIDKAIKLNAAQLKLARQELKLSDDSTEKLAEVQRVLSEEMANQSQKIQSLSNKLKEVEQAEEIASYGALDLREKIAKATIAYNSMEAEMKEVTKQILESSNITGDYGSVLESSTQEAKGFGGIMQKIFADISEDAKKGKLSLESAWDSIKSGLLDVQSQATGAGDVISSSLSGAPVLAAGGLVAAVAKIAWEGKQVANRFEASSVQIQNALNLTKEKADEAAKSVKNVYNQGLADSQETAQEVLTNVMKYFEAEGKEAEEFSNKILAIGLDSEETIRTARTLAQQFGISYSEALDLIAAGVTSIKAPQGEILDALNEYANSFSRLGYDAGGFLSTLAAGMDAGAYSVDKAADSIKEFYNKAASGDTAFAEALGDLGMNANSAMNALTAGGDRANRQLEQILIRLDNVKKEEDRARIASALFGSQWEDVGTKAILAMGQAEKSLVSYSGRSDEMYKNILTSSENINKRTERTMADIGAQALNYGSYLLGPFRGLYDGIENTVKFFTEQSIKVERDGYETGANLSAGVLEGWESGNSALISAAEKTIRDMNEGMKQAADIHSPSRLFRDEVGKQLAAGVEVGWRDEIQNAYRSIQKFNQDAAELVRTPIHASSYGAQAAPPSQGDTYNDYSEFNLDISDLSTFQQVVNWAENRRLSQRKGYVRH